MSDKKRMTIIILSVLTGSLLSYMLFIFRKGTLTSHDYFMLFTNMGFALLIVLGIGFYLLKRKKQD
ncbi:MAG: hypothetical protein HKN75_06155 [Bacteroidia bacterium]|nr:hypothetical protein [Bacteroidia bacterium]